MNSDLTAEENKGRIAQWEEHGVDAIRADLEYSNGTRYVGKYRDLAWKWVESKKKTPLEKKDDVLIVHPNFCGIGINFNAVWQRLKNKLIVRKPNL